MANYLNLQGFDNVFSNTLNNELQDNLVEFLDWGLLEKGNYYNVTLGELSPTNARYDILKLSPNPNYTSGVAWEGFRSNWVWQSGISYIPAPRVGTQVARPGISGVYVNSTFYPSSTTGTYAHGVDYYNGRVIFDNPIPTGSIVQAEYSYKYINVVYANSLPWIREIQHKSLDLNNDVEFNTPNELRIQLPAIAVEISPRRTMRGYQLGGGQFVYTDVLFHCLAEDEFTRNKLLDIVSLQNDRAILTFNSNILAQSGAFPLNHLGMTGSGALRYPDLVNQYPRNHIMLKNVLVQPAVSINSNFYAGVVRLTVESVEMTI